MADLSGSTAVTWEQVRTSLIRATGDLLQPQDQVLLVEFNQKIQIARTIQQPAELARVLPAKEVGGLTALYDSVYLTCADREFFERSGPRHAALILLSDGEDNLSLRGLDDAIARAQQSNIAIYTIAMCSRPPIRSPHCGLDRSAFSCGLTRKIPPRFNGCKVIY